MYLKKVEADDGGYNPYNTKEDWNRITYEETIRGKKYQVMNVVSIEYLDEHAEKWINYMQEQFNNVRNPVTEKSAMEELAKKNRI